MCMHCPNNVRRAMQTDVTSLCHTALFFSDHGTLNKCWELLAQSLTSLKQFLTTHNNMQLHVQPLVASILENA